MAVVLRNVWLLMRSAFALVFCGAQISQGFEHGSCGTFMAMLRNYGIGFVCRIIWGGGGGTGKAFLHNGRNSFLTACDALVDQNLRCVFSI